MDKILLALFIFLIVVMFVLGNILIADFVFFGNGVLDWSESWFIYLTAIVIDLILLVIFLFWVHRIFIIPLSESYCEMKEGLKNRRIAKVEAKKLKGLLDKEQPDLNRLQELRDKKVNENVTKRTLCFCKLIEILAGREQLQDCLTALSERQNILDEIHGIENQIINIAEKCTNANDFERCQYYLDILKAARITPEIASFEDRYLERLIRQKREKKVIQLWIKGTCGVFICLFAILISLYIKDTPRRELCSMIREQSLTAEMCDESNEDNKGSIYNYLISKKGCKVLASELTKMHKENDVEKAMWLLCLQPDCIDGDRLRASSDFIGWILEYAMDYGVKSTTPGKDMYSIDGYQIIVVASARNISGMINNGFLISDGKNEKVIKYFRRRNKDSIPTIE